MSAVIYVEGGGDSKELHIRCREAFSKLLNRCGFAGRMPRLVACGPRGATFKDFKTAHSCARGEFVAMLVDSEDPVADINEPWQHLVGRDKWTRPDSAADEQVFLMTTCRETWIVSDRQTLAAHYGDKLQASALPALDALEGRPREAIQDALDQATRTCTNAYRKGRRSFEVVGKLNPDEMAKHLPSFVRMKRILDQRLPTKPRA